MPNGVNDLVDRERPYPLHPDVPAYIMALLAEVQRLEDLILAADEYEGLMPMIEPEAAAIRERRK